MITEIMKTYSVAVDTVSSLRKFPVEIFAILIIFGFANFYVYGSCYNKAKIRKFTP